LNGCSGEDQKQEAVVQKNIEVTSNDLINESWIVRMANDANRKKFEGNQGWAAYFNREYSTALTGLDGVAKARLHAELSAAYRQATLMHAHATNNIYDKDRQEEDGNDTYYLRGVSKILLGEKDNGLSDFEKVTDPNLQNYSVQWKTMLGGKGDITGNFVSLPELNSMKIPNPEAIPHFSINTTVEGVKVGVTDATELWARAVWHEKAAKALVENDSLIDIWLDPWRLPFENVKIEKTVTFDDEWLFLSKYLVSDDASFLVDLSEKKLQAISDWKDKSILASALVPCIVDGKIAPDKVLDAAAELEIKLIQLMKDSTGIESPMFPIFADFAEQAVLQAGVFAAVSNDQSRDAHQLRINANDLVQTNSNDVVFQLSFAAQDIANRFPTRPQDKIHFYSTEFPALRVVKQPLDTLQIRLGRNSAPGAAN
jgi:hypothetical protein